MNEGVRKYIENSRDLIISLQDLLTSHPALGPENGGDGEYEKAMALKEYISSWGFDSIEEVDIEDKRVSTGKRPSIIATIYGKNSEKNRDEKLYHGEMDKNIERKALDINEIHNKLDINKVNNKTEKTDNGKTLWIISHLDVVPPGDINLWDSDPYKIRVVGDKIYGRGTEDNQQGIVASLVAAKAIIENRVKPDINVKLLFVCDEELGSDYGIIPLIEKGLFKKNDLILTPDVGDPEGAFIEIAEKSILWLEFSIQGKQSHGSRPDLGINAARASSILDLKLSELYKIYSDKNNLFDIPYSTFEPTKRVGSVQNFNTIPGYEILCYDCRIIPQYDLNEILKTIEKIVKDVENETKTIINMRIAQKVQAPEPTDENAEIVKYLKQAIKNITEKEAKTYGIGGGTVAAYFRKKGINAALWSTLDNTMHSPNEYSSIKNTIQDSLVFAELIQIVK